MHQDSFPLYSSVVRCWTAQFGEVLSRTEDHVFRDLLGDCLLSLPFGPSPQLWAQQPHQLGWMEMAGWRCAHLLDQVLARFHSTKKKTLSSKKRTTKGSQRSPPAKGGTYKGLPTLPGAFLGPQHTAKDLLVHLEMYSRV